MNKKLVFFIFIALILLSVAILILRPKLTGSAIAGNAGNEVAENGSLQVYFCPRDNCSQKLLSVINEAHISLDCALFDMNLQPVSDALSEKAQTIPVKVVFDDTNKKHIDKLNPSFEYKFDTDQQLSHNKFCTVDNAVVFTGSMNPTLRDDQHNNNNILIIHSTYLAQNYHDEFNELWQGAFGKGSPVKYPLVNLNGIPVENYFCPEDHCEQHVVKEIRNAKHTVYFMTFSFTSEQIADAILTNKALADIKGIFEKSQNSKYSQYERLKDFGLDVRWDANKYNLHDKVFIIDNETVITGSYNPTTHGDEKNDENMLIIHDKRIAEKYLEEFRLLFYS